MMADADRAALARLQSSLTNHSPSAEQISAIEAIREAAKTYGALVIRLAPDGPARQEALVDLETSTMWAVKAIVLPREG